MSSLPSRRILVYVVAGLVVLIVGGLGLLLGRQDEAGSQIVVSAPDGGSDAGAAAVPGATTSADSATTTVAEPEPALIYVQVAGAVRRPGVYRVRADARVFQVVEEAGGFTEDADEQAVPLAARVSDGCRLLVPRLGEASQQPVLSEMGVPGTSNGGGAGVISLNTATLEQLDSLPGIGPTLARQIIEYRETHGPFTSVEQLTEVPGIGAAKLEQLRPLVGL
jgi:competence protein ComEA